MVQENIEEHNLIGKSSINYETLDLYTDIISQVLVNYDLDDLYFKDREKALDLVGQYTASDESPAGKKLTCVPNFLHNRDKLSVKIENMDENDEDEMISLLFQLVRLFESIVNEYIYCELLFKDFTRKEIKKVQRKLTTEDKLGWFLKLINGKDYTDCKNWSLINNYILARNFYIHYAPDTLDTYDNHEEILTKDSFMSFLNYSSDCYSFLKECRCKEYIEHFERVSKVKKNMKDEYVIRNKG